MHSLESRHRHITIYLFWSNPVNPRCHGILRLNHHAAPKSEAKRNNQLLSGDADNLSRELFSIGVMKSPIRTPWSSMQPRSLGTLLCQPRHFFMVDTGRNWDRRQLWCLICITPAGGTASRLKPNCSPESSAPKPPYVWIKHAKTWLDHIFKLRRVERKMRM
jgi:hypothetical protein